MERSKRQNWLEECAIISNEFSWYEGEKDFIIEKWRVMTKYNRFVLVKAYRMIYQNNKIQPFFVFENYL